MVLETVAVLAHDRAVRGDLLHDPAAVLVPHGEERGLVREDAAVREVAVGQDPGVPAGPVREVPPVDHLAAHVDEVHLAATGQRGEEGVTAVTGVLVQGYEPGTASPSLVLVHEGHGSVLPVNFIRWDLRG